MKRGHVAFYLPWCWSSGDLFITSTATRVLSTAGTSLAMAASVAARAASCTELHRNRGTEGSNPLWTSS
jgi:hypothetical protein